MIVLIHIAIALASLAASTYTFFYPSQRRLGTSYALLAATIASGTYLAVGSHTHMLEVCTLGISYVAAVTILLAAAHKKLAHANSTEQ